MTISDESKQAARKTLGTTEFYLSLDKMAEIIQQAINLHERDLVEALKKLAALYQSGAGWVYFGNQPFDGDTSRLASLHDLRNEARAALKKRGD